MSTTTARDAARPGLPAPARRPGDTLRFGAFPITETQGFPPAAGAQCWVYLTLNAEIALSWAGNPVLQQLVRSPRARISVDGQWLWWGLRRKYPQQPLAKLSGSDLIHRLAARCAASGQRLLLLGASVPANAGAVQALRQRWPGLAVSGYAPAPCADAAAERAMQAEALAAIAAWRADYVVLGLGADKEQRFALHSAAALDGQVTGLLCFGGAIDMASGTVRRAPPLWRTLGAEGLYRVLQQPSRLGRLFRVLRVLPVLARGRF